MRVKRKLVLPAVAILVLGLFFNLGLAEDGFKAIQSKIVEHTLKNGMRLIILPRHEAPVISFHTYVDVGSVNEHKGITGLAHLFEHMAFKGTKQIGTKDYEKENVALGRIDDLYMKLEAEKAKKEKSDPEKLKQLENEFRMAQEEAAKYETTNEFGQIIEQAGGVNLNAFTTADSTQYHFSLPSNKLELWMSLESDRFLNPVLRDFYKERNVVMEERRLRVESDPIGKLVEKFLSVAYDVHPYREPTIGYMGDLEALTRSTAEQFFRTYYIPSNMTVAIVGDVDPQEVIRLADIYFGRIPSAPKPRGTIPEEPPQSKEKRFTIEEQSQRVFLAGYHKPSIQHKDEAVFDAITDILGIGRTSRLYTGLVKKKKIATVTQAFTGFPGDKYPNLFLFLINPAPGHTNEEVETAFDEEIERLKGELVDQVTLKRVQTRAKATLLRRLNSNPGMAEALTYYQALMGSWRNLFQQLDKINAVTAEDIKRVANEYFQKKNRTIGIIEPATK